MGAYLDHAASTPMLDCARDALVAALPMVGNASSLHAAGRAARRSVEESREAIAAGLGVAPGELVLTGGGTEADNLAIKGLWWARTEQRPDRRTVLVSRVEHQAVLAAVRWLEQREGAEVVWLEVDGQGRVDPGEVADRLREHVGTVALAAVMWANNEVGTVQPIAPVAEACRHAGVPLHVDAVQALGSVPVAAALPTTLAVSAHKIGGPGGVGALVVRRGTRLVPLHHGGGQEMGLRSGTSGVPAIAGFAAAVAHVVADLPERSGRIGALRDELVAGIARFAEPVVVNGPVDRVDRLPGIAHLSFPGCDGDALLMLLDAAGVQVSTGSACAAGVPQPSHVLAAMGVGPAVAGSSIRISLGHTTTAADVEALLAALPAALDRVRRAGRARGRDGAAGSRQRRIGGAAGGADRVTDRPAGGADRVTDRAAGGADRVPPSSPVLAGGAS